MTHIMLFHNSVDYDIKVAILAAIFVQDGKQQTGISVSVPRHSFRT